MALPQTKLPRQLLLAIGIIVLPLFAANVYACQCRMRQPPCAQYWSADAVFIGSVIKISPVDQDPRQKIQFSVERAIAGVSGRSVELDDYRTSCSYEFTEGKTYLVYAYQNSERSALFTHYCTRTTELTNAGADLAFLKLISEKRHSQQILGVLADGDKRLRGIRIVASSGGRNYRTTSDKDGWFSLNVTRPGTYRVRMVLPLYSDVVGLKTELDRISKRVVTRTGIVLEYDVVVEPGRCVFIDPPLFIDQLEYEKRRFHRITGLAGLTCKSCLIL